MKVKEIIAIMQDWQRVTISTEDACPTLNVEDVAEELPDVLDREVYDIHYSMAFNSIWIECEEGCV